MNKLMIFTIICFFICVVLVFFLNLIQCKLCRYLSPSCLTIQYLCDSVQTSVLCWLWRSMESPTYNWNNWYDQSFTVIMESPTYNWNNWYDQCFTVIMESPTYNWNNSYDQCFAVMESPTYIWNNSYDRVVLSKMSYSNSTTMSLIDCKILFRYNKLERDSKLVSTI